MTSESSDDAEAPPGPATEMSGWRDYYGWRVVGAVFVMMTIASGLAFYNLAVFLEALTTARHFSISLVSGATAYFFIVTGLTGLAVGRLIDRFDPRWTIGVGAVMAGAGLLAVGAADTVATLFAAYTVLGIGFSATSLVPGTTLVARWFEKRRSMALSLATSGLSVGGIVMTPLSAYLIKTWGLADATPFLAGIYVAVGVPVALMIRMPSAGDRIHADAAGGAAAGRGVPFAAAVRSRFFIVVTTANVIVLMAQVGGMAHQFNLVAERIDAVVAAQAVSLLAASSMTGRLIGGWVLGRWNIRSFAFTMITTQALALAFLAVASSSFTLLAGSVLFGLTIGNNLMVLPLILAVAFGVRDYGRIYSLAMLATTVGNAVGPFVMGALRDITGGYAGSYLMVAVLALAALAVFAAAGPVNPMDAPGNDDQAAA
jgi:MFS family permease